MRDGPTIKAAARSKSTFEKSYEVARRSERGSDPERIGGEHEFHSAYSSSGERVRETGGGEDSGRPVDDLPVGGSGRGEDPDNGYSGADRGGPAEPVG